MSVDRSLKLRRTLLATAVGCLSRRLATAFVPSATHWNVAGISTSKGAGEAFCASTATIHRSRRACDAALLQASSSSPGAPLQTRTGLVFPKDAEDGWFDSASVGSPRVHRYFHDEGERWVMWYHGQDEGWREGEGKGVVDLGTGRIGRAESPDGLTWKRTPGPMALSCVLDKNVEQWWGFDTAHVGLGDVNLGVSNRVVADSSVYFMYYFGGSHETTDVGEFGLSNKPAASGSGGAPKGVQMRIGVALSQDGLNWCRVEGEHPSGACLDVGEAGDWDRLFVGWPVVINHKEQEFRMYYTALDPDTKKFRVGMATSQDGFAWAKKGPVFDGGPEGSFDDAGVSRRRVVMLNGVYHMVYEGVNKEGVHAFGLATSSDGVRWERRSDRPIFERSPPGSGAWDAGGVSHPELVDLEDGRWYLYYAGFPEKPAGEGEAGRQGSCLGVAMATGNDLTSWTRVAV